MRTLNTKSKSGSGAGLKKEYYLAKYLQFLNPFSKSRPQGGNIPVQTQETVPDVNDFTAHGFNIIEQPSYTVSGVTYADEDPRTQEMQSPPAHSSAPLYSSTPSMSTTQSTYIRKKQMSEADKCAVDYFTSKKKENGTNRATEKRSMRTFSFKFSTTYGVDVPATAVAISKRCTRLNRKYKVPEALPQNIGLLCGLTQ